MVVSINRELKNGPTCIMILVRRTPKKEAGALIFLETTKWALIRIWNYCNFP